MYITIKEKNALLEAIDFISTNSDGADDPDPFEDLNSLLLNIFLKANKEIVKRKIKKRSKKLIHRRL